MHESEGGGGRIMDLTGTQTANRNTSAVGEELPGVVLFPGQGVTRRLGRCWAVCGSPAKRSIPDAGMARTVG